MLTQYIEEAKKEFDEFFKEMDTVSQPEKDVFCSYLIVQLTALHDKVREEKCEENDDPEISEKDFEDMYISQGKDEREKMERRFNIWLENRDDDFELDIWDFRCLQDFIFEETKVALSASIARGK